MNLFKKLLIYAKMSARAILNQPSLPTLVGSLRFFPAWWKHLRPGRNSVSDQMPWMAFGAIEYLDRLARPDMCVFEYGSGGSTLFWAARVRQVISVEHDKAWFEKLQEQLLKRGIKNVEYQYIAAGDKGKAGGYPGNPADYLSADQHYAGKTFEAYVKSIDQYPDEYFDLVVIDGRARPSCILHAVSKIKKNGYLVVDNSERGYYLSSFSFRKTDWEQKDFLGPVPYVFHFSRTSIFKKLKAVDHI